MKNQISDIELISALEARPELLQKLIRTTNENVAIELSLVNEKLVNAQKVQTGFLSNIRNEIINPITALLELSSTLAEIVKGEGSILSQLINDEVKRLDFQLRNIIVSAEVEAGETNLITQSCHIPTLVQDAVMTLFQDYKKKNISFNVSGTATTFRTDFEKLSLIVLNLISNGIQFSPSNGEIDIIYDLDNEKLVISVIDNGPGISEENQREIFARFTQLDSGSTKRHGGHGLGLTLTQALLDILGGTLTIESTLGSGSTFTVSIPNMEGESSSEDVFAMEDDFLFVDVNEKF